MAGSERHLIGLAYAGCACLAQIRLLGCARPDPHLTGNHTHMHTQAFAVSAIFPTAAATDAPAATNTTPDTMTMTRWCLVEGSYFELAAVAVHPQAEATVAVPCRLTV
jgi:hypothetical protein